MAVKGRQAEIMTPTLAQIRDRLTTEEIAPGTSEAVVLAAVAIIFREHEGEPELLLIKRSDRDSDPWSGHMAFPGGRISTFDDSARQAAERETWEEIGLDLSRHGQLIGILESERPAIRVTGLTLDVAPFVYELKSEPARYELNHEVAAMHWAKIGPMWRQECLTSIEWELEGSPHMMPGFAVDGNVVWGMTFRMLTRMFRLISPDSQALD